MQRLQSQMRIPFQRLRHYIFQFHLLVGRVVLLDRVGAAAAGVSAGHWQRSHVVAALDIDGRHFHIWAAHFRQIRIKRGRLSASIVLSPLSTTLLSQLFRRFGSLFQFITILHTVR